MQEEDLSRADSPAEQPSTTTQAPDTTKRAPDRQWPIPDWLGATIVIGGPILVVLTVFLVFYLRRPV